MPEGNFEKPEDFGIFWVVHIHTEREGSDSTINLAMAQHDRDPSSVMVENLMQYSGDLNNLGDIAFTRRTVQRKRCHFKVYVNDYWGVPNGTYHDNDTKKRVLRGPEAVRKFMRSYDTTIRYITQQGPKRLRMVQKMTSEAAIRNAGECLMVAI